MLGSGRAPTPILKSFMVFIDGSYLRKGLKEILGHDNIDYGSLLNFLKRSSVPRTISARVELDVIRAHYYDAVVVDQAKHPEVYEEECKYFEKVQRCEYYEVKLGRHIITEKRDEQKGVDVKIAIDMITKAYQNHYEIATLLAGDDDFVDVVKTVKDIAGKRVIGAAFERSVSAGLKKAFDAYINLDESKLVKFELRP